MEQALAMGYPVVPAAAGAAAVPLDVAVHEFPAGAVGNAMHVANVGCVFMVALSCVAPLGD